MKLLVSGDARGDIDARIELDLRLRRSAEGGLVFEAAGRAIGMTRPPPARAPHTVGHHCAGSRRGLRATGASRAAISASASGSYQSRAAYRGPMVMNVDPRGPGATAGIYQGGIVVNWNGEPIRNVQSVLHALGPDSIGHTVTIGLRRAAR
jgi:hypothetical protein